MTDNLYGALAAPFDKVFTDNRGGVTLSYITGEQVISRLNEVVGPLGWGFSVDEHGMNAEADEIWVKGTLTVNVGDERSWRMQFGSQKLKRRRSDNTVLDIGFDLKGATTDCLKKCAQAFGVGLYLSEREPQDSMRGNLQNYAVQPNVPQTPYRGTPPTSASEPSVRRYAEQPKVLPTCSKCGKSGVALRGIQGELLCSDCSGLTNAAR